MSAHEHLDLINHLCRNSALEADEAERLVSEVLAFFQEDLQTFVRRRHRELQAHGRSNATIYEVIALELPHQLFPVATLSTRQIRRIIYG